MEYERDHKTNTYNVVTYIDGKKMCESSHDWMGDYLQNKLPVFIAELSDITKLNCFPKKLDFQYKNGKEFLFSVATSHLVQLVTGLMTWESLVSDVLKIQKPSNYDASKIEEEVEELEKSEEEPLTQQEVIKQEEQYMMTGFENLSCFFSDNLVVRLKNGSIESPISGKWVAYKSIAGIKKVIDENWALLNVRALLQSRPHIHRFYFNYRWNHSSTTPWIQRTEIDSLLQRLEKEKKEDKS